MYGRKNYNLATSKRGDSESEVNSTGRRVTLCASSAGFSLIELVLTITVMTILTLGVIPLVKISVKRQKEQQLHETLRQIRSAIDDFHRDTVGMVCTGTTGLPGGGTAGGFGPNPQPNILTDPRSKVVISDCTVFGVDNPDRYPPTLEMLTEGVNVIPRAGSGVGGKGLVSTGTATSDSSSQLDSQLA